MKELEIASAPNLNGKDKGRDEGREEGRKEGREEGRKEGLCRKLEMIKN